MARKARGGRERKTASTAVRRVCYSVAMSLDGFIAGPNGEIDWILMDPDIDFAAMTSRFDTMIMGRGTYEATKQMGGGGGGGGSSSPDVQVYVVSRTMRKADHPGVNVVDDPAPLVAGLRAKPGKDLWLFGGGSLFRSLVELELVDTVEVAVIPVLLGEGVPLLPPPSTRVKLELTGQKVYPKTGIVSLDYIVQYARAPKRRK